MGLGSRERGPDNLSEPLQHEAPETPDHISPGQPPSGQQNRRRWSYAKMAPNGYLGNLPQTRLFELKSSSAAKSVNGAKQLHQLTSACLRSRRCPTAPPDSVRTCREASRSPPRATSERLPTSSGAIETFAMPSSSLGVCVHVQAVAPSGSAREPPAHLQHQSQATPRRTVARPSAGDTQHGYLLITENLMI